MMNINRHGSNLAPSDVQGLIRGFMDGETSPAQERAVYEFFASHPAGSIPRELEQYRPMFAWYAGLSTEVPASPRHNSWMRRAGIAAAIAFAAGAAWFIAGNSKDVATENELYAQYKGSYIIRDGKRITDLNEIYPIIARAEYTADSLSRLAADDEEIINRLNEQIADMALSGISDHSLAVQLMADFDDNHTY